MEAAEALGVDPGRVFKTLMALVDGKLCVGIVPVMGSLDLKALADALGGKKAQMADTAQAQRATGYVIGGISPFGQKRQHPTVDRPVVHQVADGVRLRRSTWAGGRARPGRPRTADVSRGGPTRALGLVRAAT